MTGATARRQARIAGALYLYIIAAGTFAEVFVRSSLVVGSDAAATAHHITAHEALFRAGFSAELLHLSFDVGIAAILYTLLAPVGRTLALVAALMRLSCDVLLAMASLGHFATLRLLDRPEGLDAGQAEAMALLAMQLHGDGYAISLVFFAFACLSLGILVFRATFLPSALGVLLGIAGVCYLVNSFAVFLAPAVASVLFPPIFLPIFVAEVSFALWLVARGVDPARWEEQARASGLGPRRQRASQ